MHSKATFAFAAAIVAFGGFAITNASAMQPEAVPDGGGLITPAWTPLGVSGAPVTVVVQLPGDPVAVQQANAGRRLERGEKDRIKGQLKGTQDNLRGSIERLGGKVVAQYQASYNGIKVRISSDKLSQLRALPGVLAVRPVFLAQPDNTHGVPFIGAPGVWESLGLHGEGVKVAIIDTGIDYTHANFGGPGTSAAYDLAHASETAPANPAWFGPAAPRIKGGIDLVGDSYNADPQSASYQPVPHPDPNPLDCDGHGSHVAGTTAGSGVHGRRNAIHRPVQRHDDLRQHVDRRPGRRAEGRPVRGPRLRLRGIDRRRRRRHRMGGRPRHGRHQHVARIGRSAPRTPRTPKRRRTPRRRASSSSPRPATAARTSTSWAHRRTAEGAISVAANDPTPFFPGATILLSNAVLMNAINANGYVFVGPTAYTVKVIADNPATLATDESLGCSVADFGGPLPPNTIAVVNRGVCARVAKAIFGQQAGAAAVVMVNNATGLPPFEGTITSNPDDGTPFLVTIPFLGVAGPATNPASDGAKLRAANGLGSTVSPVQLANPAFTAFASFTSGGPRTGDSALKPDVTAPGVSIVSTLSGSGNRRHDSVRNVDGLTACRRRRGAHAPGAPDVEGRGHQGRDPQHRPAVRRCRLQPRALAERASSSRRSRRFRKWSPATTIRNSAFR